MQFSLAHTQLDFEIPDDWWDEAGMVEFQPTSQTYCVAPNDKWLLKIVALDEVKPPTRSPGVRWFDQTRMVYFLECIVLGDAIPPIEVHEPPNTELRYEVRDGFHRFYASVAAGFKYLPVSVLPYFNIKDGSTD